MQSLSVSNVPGNVTPAPLTSPISVLPKSLSTAFTETFVYPMLTQFYHDNTVERSIIEDFVNPSRAIRTWTLAKRLTAVEFQALLAFWEQMNGGLYSFYFYNPQDVTPGMQPGSNWDGSGVSTIGRIAVRFQGDWQHAATVGLVDVPQILMIESIDQQEFHQDPTGMLVAG